ncbi:MAG: hypothetical protein IPI79_15340 [Moraxellaceae bacterium]|nr:hypothetical protein [Moraxellaceae bacterium]
MVTKYGYRDNFQRQLLFDLDMTIIRLRQQLQDSPESSFLLLIIIIIVLRQSGRNNGAHLVWQIGPVFYKK